MATSDLVQIAAGRNTKGRYFDGLGISLREFFIDKKDFVKLFDDVDVANFCSSEINQRIKCYRPELGAIADKITKTYEKVIEKLLELIMKLSNEKDSVFAKKMEENQSGIEKLNIDKAALE